MLVGRRVSDNETIDSIVRSVGKPAGNSVDNNGYPQISTDVGSARLQIDFDDLVIGLGPSAYAGGMLLAYHPLIVVKGYHLGVVP
jgi:hypothetical protein